MVNNINFLYFYKKNKTIYLQFNINQRIIYEYIYYISFNIFLPSMQITFNNINNTTQQL